jgi:hypothetical protein
MKISLPDWACKPGVWMTLNTSVRGDRWVATVATSERIAWYTGTGPDMDLANATESDSPPNPMFPEGA